MSVVTNVILTYGVSDMYDGPLSLGILPDINAYCFDRNIPAFIRQFDESYGVPRVAGSKQLECEILLGAFNHFSIAEFIDHLRSLPWQDKDSVQLFIQEQDDNRFTERDVF